MGRTSLWQDATSRQQAASRRKSARRPTSTPCRVRSPAGEVAAAMVRDISVFGCSVACDAGWLTPGRFIAIRLEATQSLQAIVRWARDGEAGLEFLRPIPADRSEWTALMDAPYGG